MGLTGCRRNQVRDAIEFVAQMGVEVGCRPQAFDHVDVARDALRRLLDWINDYNRVESDARAIYTAASAVLAKAER